MSYNKEQVESTILQHLDAKGPIANTFQFFEQTQITPSYDDLIGALNSLTAESMINFEVPENKADRVFKSFVLTKGGEEVVALGSPEARLFNLVPPEGITVPEAMAALGKQVFGPGSGNCMKNKWIRNEKKTLFKVAETITDTVQQDLISLSNGGAFTAAQGKAYSKRKMVKEISRKVFTVSKGSAFALQRGGPKATDLTDEMLRTGEWKQANFKPYNWDAQGAGLTFGTQHPLMKMKAEVHNFVSFSSLIDFFFFFSLSSCTYTRNIDGIVVKYTNNM